MHKLWASTYKELLLLIRDFGGLATLFIMPLLLVITITVIQDGTFKTLKETKIPIVLVDLDQGEISKNIEENLKASERFEVVLKADAGEAKNLVQTGKYQLAIVIPENLSQDLHLKVGQNVEGILKKFSGDEDGSPATHSKLEPKEIKLFFDPATQFSFRNSIKSGIDQMVSKIETETIYKAFQKELTDDPTEAIFDTEP
ncbi:MAG: ABC transporter permease, partial [Flavobacteriaceae bacterium]